MDAYKQAFDESVKRGAVIATIRMSEVGDYFTNIGKRIAEAELKAKGFYTCYIGQTPHMLILRNREAGR